MLGGGILVVLFRQSTLLIGTIALLLTLVEFKYSRKTSAILVVSFSAAALLLNNLLVAFGFNDAESTAYFGYLCALIIVPTFAILFLLEKDNFFIIIFNFFTQMLLVIGIVIISYYISLFCFKGNPWGDMVLRVALIALAAFLEKKFLYSPFRMIVSNIQNKWIHLSWIPMFLFYLVAALCLFPRPFCLAGVNPTDTYSALDFIIIIVITYIAIVVVFANVYSTLYDIIKFIKEENDVSLMRAQNKYWEQKIEISSKNMEEVKRQTHDLHHHNMVALGYLQNGDVEGAKAYLQSHDKRLEEEFVEDFCLNKAVNSVLVVNAQKAKQAGIQVKIQTSVPESTKIHETELVGIFANAFENAIEGCLRLPEKTKKYINVTSDYKNGMLYIQLINSCVDDIKFDGEFPISSKDENGGTGTKSIGYIVSKHKGMVQFSAKDGVFKTRVVIAA